MNHERFPSTPMPLTQDLLTASATSRRVVVCTMAEGSYFAGVAALANSLVMGGFHGDIVVGFRGETPAWLTQLTPDIGADCYQVAPQVRLRLIRIEPGWHLTNLKAQLMIDVLDTICPEAEGLFYFDPDIVIDCEWHVLANWTKDGVVMALDVSNSFMSPHHVYRRSWTRLAEARGYACREMTGYVNAGCVGIGREHADLIRIWADLMQALAQDGIDMTRLKYEGGRPEFASMDQDILNASLMASDVPLALLGYESMGVYPRKGNLMPHAMFDKKPWVRPYVLDALRGIPPGRSHLAFWRHVDGPIRPFSPPTLARKRLLVTIARLIGLVHVRNPRDL